MTRHTLVALAGSLTLALAVPVWASDQEPSSTAVKDLARERAVATVTRLRGKLTTEGGDPDGPVVAVDLSRTRVMDDDLGSLAGLNCLRSLNLASTRVTDDGLRHLGRLTALERLSLHDNIDIKGPGL